jgi:hypothetical protein
MEAFFQEFKLARSQKPDDWTGGTATSWPIRCGGRCPIEFVCDVKFPQFKGMGYHQAAEKLGLDKDLVDTIVSAADNRIPSKDDAKACRERMMAVCHLQAAAA